jgi:hypothetical protein
VRISPGNAQGTAYYDFGPISKTNASLELEWADNGWIEGDKGIFLYNWTSNQWQRIDALKRTNTNFEKTVLQFSIPSGCLNKEKVIRVGVWSSAYSVIHLKSIKFY